MGRFSIRTHIHTYIRPSVCPPLEGLRASQASLRPSQSGLRASQAGLRACQPALRARQSGFRASQASEPASQASVALRPAWLALRPDRLGLRPAWLALRPSRGGTDVRTDGRTNGKSPHSTGLCPLSGLLPCYSPTLTQKLYKAGQGYC